ncbi:hypothetical protein SAMN02982929_06023 [Saccharopolyspora kobensis]|uniref:Secreted protein n=1 Tax=Saccharopolyspora kobensis TaxID=146035 RepID=A0A1H6ECZ7_9PSEU|nr:hypothetical protein [Saccharopolyspora kobensis]SEG94889.1 hypothetical protein SAMN02982929_06023 [Saccharopolyspora kobensis]SFD62061.1 hypothetical protein SAMN05216506_105263 [Saccharopolyspora kobensis]
MRIHRAFTYAGVWLVATTAAVTVTWLGVRDIIQDTVFDQPAPPKAARPVVAPPPPPSTPLPAPSSTSTPEPPPPTTVDTQVPEPPPESETAADVRTFEVDGGTVVLSVRPERATLISATPRPGYTVQTWEHPDGWLRVEFSTEDDASTLIATWHAGPTSVETFEH